MHTRQVVYHQDVSLTLYFCFIYYSVYMYDVYVDVGGHLSGVNALLLLCGFWGLSSNYQACMANAFAH